MYAHLEIIKLLVERGADPFLEDFRGYMAIHTAEHEKRGEVVHCLRTIMSSIRSHVSDGDMKRINVFCNSEIPQSSNPEASSSVDTAIYRNSESISRTKVTKPRLPPGNRDVSNVDAVSTANEASVAIEPTGLDLEERPMKRRMTWV